MNSAKSHSTSAPATPSQDEVSFARWIPVMVALLGALMACNWFLVAWAVLAPIFD